MHVPRLRATVALTAALLGLTAASAAPVPAGPTDEQLKEIALKLNSIAAKEAAFEKVNELLKDKPTAKRLVKVAAKLHKDAPEKEPPFKFNAALALGRLAQAVKEYDAAETLLDYSLQSATAVKSGSKMLDALDGLLDLYAEQKKYQAMEKLASRFLEEAEERGEKTTFSTLLVMERLAVAKAHTGDVDGAMQIVNNLTKLPKLGTYFLPARADVLREAGKYERAISALEDYLEKIDDLKELLTDEGAIPRLKKRTKYQLSGLYVDADQIDKAVEQLRALLKDDPDNPTFYNDLGFVMADHGRNLEESETLVRKALELDAKQRKKLLEEKKIDKELAARESAAYLDSMGWVLFKRGKPKEALPYLEKATKDEDDGKHIEIWDHLADCLVALGEKKKAVEVWQKALTFDDISKRDLERRKKVTEKLNKMKAELSK
ncbi:MAG: tetratricopeptide repeat protein [Gemmataceae bacterium]